MKPAKLILSLLSAAILISCNRNSIEIDQTVNAVIGDISYLEAFGHSPDAATDENQRIRTHLLYVEQLLRSRDVSDLTKEQQENRLSMLNLLAEYRSAGDFPKNYDYPDQRIPCFIDQNGSICAVGYLIEQTSGRQVAEEINAKYKYEYLLAMNDETIDEWVHSSGLTALECAMIQPTYNFIPPPNDPLMPANYISPAYGVSSSVLSGINLSLNAMNGIQILKGSTGKAVPIAGLVAGAGQITLGALNYPKENTLLYGTQNNVAERNLSLLNIGLGTSTLILSSWNLLTNRTPKEKSLSWNVYSYPTENSHVGVGFSLTKRL